MSRTDVQTLREHGINPSAQRVAVASYVLHTEEHPSAEKVWERVRKRLPMVSRATVYNTLNLFADRGLLRPVTLAEGCVVFDANVAAHHHFIDDETGAIHDVAWDALEVSGVEALEGFEVREYQVVMRGRKKKEKRSARGRRRQ